ncbi:DUF4174 domain-containing protein [Sphingomonas sp. FW199]|uniref:DUF4174 domain-containing protein n=1 Tax=Sphingomonas sp. FW199 TaxID=3400217 RepID=UPI003CEF997D
MTALPALIAALALQSAPTLEAMRWEKRVIVLFADSEDSAARQRAMLSDRMGMAERDLHLIEVIGDRVSGTSTPAGDLRRRLKPETPFTLILIGKDGGVKLRSGEPVSARRLFETVDAMPMRASEGKARQSPF